MDIHEAEIKAHLFIPIHIETLHFTNPPFVISALYNTHNANDNIITSLQKKYKICRGDEAAIQKIIKTARREARLNVLFMTLILRGGLGTVRNK